MESASHQSLKKLARDLVAPSRALLEFLISELSRQEDLKKGSMYDLYRVFKEKVSRGLSPEEFCIGFVQMIPAGLFSAYLKRTDNISFTLEELKNYIAKSFEFTHSLGPFLDALQTNEYEEVRVSLREMASIINIFSKESGRSLEKDPYIHFYEDFLAEFDTGLRRKLGVYYTPLPIVRFIVQGVEDILKKVFEIPQGLSDLNVTALDFATGTGTFLLEMFRKVLETVPLKSEKRDPIIQNHLLKNFYGFEYMLTPYLLAQLKLSEFLMEEGYTLKSTDRLGVSLANTLESLDKSFTREGGENPILVIVGNPPYKGESCNKGAFITNLIKDYRFMDGVPLGERNSKWLQDDYVKFIRFAQHKMDQVEEGIVGVITNHSFLDNPTFRGMRSSLLKSFNQIYIVNLHGNSKRKEQAPDGGKDENVFDIQQGVCIAFFVKKQGLKRAVYYADWWGGREEKYKSCLGTPFETVNWNLLTPNEPAYLFIPQNNKLREKYQKYVSIQDIFQESSVGIVTSRDHLTIHFSKETLMNTLSEFRDLPIEEARRKFKLGKDSRDWKVHFAQNDLIQSGLSENYIKEIDYRPFDRRITYYTGKLKGFMSMPRSNIMTHMLAGDNIGLMITRQCNINKWQHVFIGSNIAESCYVSNKTGEIGYCSPLYLTAPFKNERQKVENITPAFRGWVDDLYQYHYSPEDILGYIYAILYSPTYRSSYLEFLKGDFPRIPFTNNREHFEALSTVGQELIQSHLMKEIPPLSLGNYRGEGNDSVDKILYDSVHQQLFINPTQYFSDIPPAVWKFCIGGYQVLDKYLKSRKKRILSFEEIKNVENIVNILTFTIQKVSKIDEMYKKIIPLERPSLSWNALATKY